MPNQEEQFDFFTNNNWPTEEDPEEAKEKKIAEKAEETIDAPITKEDERKITDSTPLIINMADDWRDISFNKANYVPHQLQKFTNGKLLFMPKTSNSKHIMLTIFK